MKRFIQRCIRLIAEPILQNQVWFIFMYILLSISNLMIAYNGSRVMGMLQLFLELYSVSLILTLFHLIFNKSFTLSFNHLIDAFNIIF